MSRKLELGGGVQDRFPVLDRGRLYTRVLGGGGLKGGGEGGGGGYLYINA